jgi:hypothetical protein
MFVGHLALGLAGKRASAATSLVWFVAAVTFVDLIWPIFLLLGIERAHPDPGNTAFTPIDLASIPWSHSLLMGLVWAGGFMAVARWRGIAMPTAWLLGALVLSHWVLDFFSHAPDLTLWPGEDSRHGLGLWNSMTGTYLVEGALWIAGIAVFLAVRRLRGWNGALAFWSFVVANTAIWVTSPFATPPPDERSLAVFALAGWIVLPWAWWIERTSETRARVSTKA